MRGGSPLACVIPLSPSIPAPLANYSLRGNVWCGELTNQPLNTTSPYTGGGGNPTREIERGMDGTREGGIELEDCLTGLSTLPILEEEGPHSKIHRVGWKEVMVEG